MELFFLALLFCVIAPLRVWGSPRYIQPDDFPITRSPFDLQRREDILHVSTCGYLSGNLSLSRTAASGFMCVVDPNDKYWGFCKDTATAVADCAIFRACKDTFTCKDQCGRRDVVTNSVINCKSDATRKDHCLSDLLVAGPGQTYSYMYCGPDYKSAILSAASEFVTNVPSSATPTGVLSTNVASPSATAGTTPPTSTPSQASSGGSSSNAGAIAGGTVGGLAAVLIAAIIFWLLRKRYANKEQVYAPNTLPPYADTSTKYAQIGTESPARAEAPSHMRLSELPPVQTEPQELYGGTANDMR